MPTAIANNITVSAKSRSYPIYFGNLASYVDEMQAQLSKKILLVTTESLASLHLDSTLEILGRRDAPVCVLPNGEECKDLCHVEKILDSAFKAGLDRGSMMVALGGGVVTDMVGFASGIYERGIDFISLPTTLLAMVDASVGGKCGVNNKYGKNLIGLFHQPAAVYIDSAFLETLPMRELSAGLAEIVKICACFDFAMLERLGAYLKNNAAKSLRDALLGSTLLENLIRHSVWLKAEVVARDEEERRGIRALLNYGHTFGHAIELEGDFRTHLHGEAVSLGMVMANELSCRLGLLPREVAWQIEATLSLCGLPTRYKIKNLDSFYESFFLDKKSLDSKLRFILLEAKPDLRARVQSDLSKEVVCGVLRDFS